MARPICNLDNFHDGRSLGAAQHLAKHRDFSGTVQLIFQPAEEGRGGAKKMLADGLFDRFPCDAVYGMHNMPGIPVGRFAIRKGPFMAGAAKWNAVFKGNGGHGGASPHLAADLTIAQANFIVALQTVIGRNVPSYDTAVISVGHIAGGSPLSINVMPAELAVGGTSRCFTPGILALLDSRMAELAHGHAKLNGATCEFTQEWGTTPLVNHDEQTDVAIAAASDLVGVEGIETNARPITGGEDFAYMLQACPGAYIQVGNGDTAEVHHPAYNFNDEAIPFGASYWAELVETRMPAA